MIKKLQKATAISMLIVFGVLNGSTIVFASWAQQEQVNASDAAANDNFGYDTDISGNYAIFGAPEKQVGANAAAGVAYTYERSGSDWVQRTILTTSDGVANDKFSQSVGISPNYATGGVISKNAVYFYTRSGSTWGSEQKKTSSDAAAEDNFGFNLDLTDNYAIVGAPNNDDAGSSSGSAYIFAQSGGTWTQQAKLTASDAATVDLFGSAVALTDLYAVVGAPNDDDAGSESGSAYVYARSGSSWGSEVKITASDAGAGDYFGKSVAINGDYIIVGANEENNQGAAYIFLRNGTAWNQQAKIVSSDIASGDAFGYRVDIEDPYAIIGAFTDDDAGSESGSAYIFYRNGTDWSQNAKLTAGNAAAGDNFGLGVGITTGYSTAGARYNDQTASNAGSGYVFNYIDDVPEMSTYLYILVLVLFTGFMWKAMPQFQKQSA